MALTAPLVIYMSARNVEIGIGAPRRNVVASEKRKVMMEMEDKSPMASASFALPASHLGLKDLVKLPGNFKK